MKRILTFALVIVLALSLCACKSKDVKNVEELIDAIGEVTLESGDAIERAEAAYNELSSEEQGECENSSELKSARRKFDKIVEENEIKLVEDAINAIGVVTINSLPAIEKAQAAYDALDEDRKAKVSNGYMLDYAMESYKVAKRNNAQKYLNGLRVYEDRVGNVKFYYPDTMHFYDSDTWAADIRSFILPCIGLDDDEVWMCSIANYTGDDWVFFTKITVNVDGKNYTYNYNYFDVTRDNGNGDVWEYISEVVDDSYIEMFRAIANSNETIVRFEGDDYTYDFVVTGDDKTAITELLTAYDALK